MRERIDTTLLLKFLNKETSKEENDEILDWASASEQNREEFRKIHQAIHAGNLKRVQSEVDVDIAWNKLNDQLQKVKREPSLITLVAFRRIAVAALIILSVGFGGLWVNDHFFTEQKSGFVQFEAPNGEKSRIVLADGTHVWLNSETTLKYDVLDPRKVILSGEAYFEVKKDHAHPFEVFTSSGMKVRVTGTRFDLRSYDDEPFVETSLEEGEVIIEGNNSEKLAVLKPDQQAEYNIKNGNLEVHNVSAGIYSIWRNNELQFSNITFEELIPRIERWYGVSIKIDSEARKNNDRFTMTIKTESLRELLSMMQLTSKFTYEINGSRVEIHLK